MRRTAAAVALVTIAFAVAVVSATDLEQTKTIHSCISEDTNDGIAFYNTELSPDSGTWGAVEFDGVMLHRIELGQTCESIGLCGYHCPPTKEVFDVATSTLTLCTLKPASDACDAKIKYDKDGNFRGGQCQYKCSDSNEDDNGNDDNGNKNQAKHKLADRADFTKPKGPKV